MWVRADTPGATLKLRLREWINVWPPPHTYVGQATTAVKLTTQWQPVTVQYTTTGDPNTDSTLDLNAYVSGAPHGTCFYADDASVAVG
jgi:hypothetical protein